MTTPLGDYQVGPVLGAGGAATVSLARLIRPGGFARVVALKRLHPNLARDPAYRALLEAEGRLGGALGSANVVRVLDLVHDGEEPVLVLEHVAGLPLSKLIDDRPVPPSIASALLLDVLRGLEALHALPPRGRPGSARSGASVTGATSGSGSAGGHVHRDVCPGNVLVGIDGVARLADFGIARAVEGTRNTEFGVIKGTLRYMSPEQVADGPLDRRSDLFSAAVVLWELLAGQQLFGADDPGAIVRQLLLDPIPPLPDDCAASDELRALLQETLARAPETRPTDAKTMQARLHAAQPPATVTEVAAFVNERGHASLAPLLAALEHWPEPDASTPATPPKTSAPVVRDASAEPPSESATSGRWATLPLGLVLAVALAVGTLALATRLSTRAAVTPSGTPLLSAASASVASAGSVTAITAPTPRASQEPRAATATAIAASGSVPVKRVTPPVAPPPATTPPASCVPPYRVGPSGVRTLKAECL